MAGKVVLQRIDVAGRVRRAEDEPYGQRWTAQWMELQQWMFPLRFIHPTYAIRKR